MKVFPKRIGFIWDGIWERLSPIFSFEYNGYKKLKQICDFVRYKVKFHIKCKFSRENYRKIIAN